MSVAPTVELSQFIEVSGKSSKNVQEVFEILFLDYRSWYIQLQHNRCIQKERESLITFSVRLCFFIIIFLKNIIIFLEWVRWVLKP